MSLLNFGQRVSLQQVFNHEYVGGANNDLATELATELQEKKTESLLSVSVGSVTKKTRITIEPSVEEFCKVNGGKQWEQNGVKQNSTKWRRC